MPKRKSSYEDDGSSKKSKSEAILSIEPFENVPNEVIANFMIQGGVKAARGLALYNPLFAQVLADPVVRRRVCSGLKEVNTAFVTGNLERNVRAIMELLSIDGDVEFFGANNKGVCLFHVRANPDGTYYYYNAFTFNKSSFLNHDMEANELVYEPDMSLDQLTRDLKEDMKEFRQFGTKLIVRGGNNLSKLHVDEEGTQFATLPKKIPFYTRSDSSPQDSDEEEEVVYYIDPKYVELSDDRTYKVNPMCRDLFLNQ